MFKIKLLSSLGVVSREDQTPAQGDSDWGDSVPSPVVTTCKRDSGGSPQSDQERIRHAARELERDHSDMCTRRFGGDAT